MALAQSVRSQSAGHKKAVEPIVEPVLNVIEQALALVEPSPPRSVVPPAVWPLSEREEIKKRVANFKAQQLRMQNEREGYYLRTMSRTRAMIDREGSYPRGE